MSRFLPRTALILAGLCISLAASAQPTAVTISQIQRLPDDTLATGKLTSPMIGDTVVFVGVAQAATVADRANNDLRPILTAGRRYVNYVQDTAGGAFGGIVVLADNDTIARETLFDRIDSGDVVRITGVVQQFPTTANGNNQINLARNAEVEILYHANRPAPVLATIADFYRKDGATQVPQYVTGGKLAGSLVEIRNVTVKTSSVATSGSAAGRVTLIVVDEDGNEIRVRDQSGYFLARAAAARLEYVGQEALDHIAVVDTTDFYQTGFGTFKPPTVGTRLAKVVGAISANLSGGQTVPFMLTPMYPDDLEISTVADELATVSTVRRTVNVPTSADSVGVTFVAVRGTNPIADTAVQVIYRVDGVAGGFATAVRTGDTTFRATIPPQSAGAIVTYWVLVPDSKGQTSMSPRDTINYKYFYPVLAPGAEPTIRTIQYTPNLSGTSAFNGIAVTVSGTVVADTNDIPGDRGADPQVVIQSGRAPWSGLWVSVKSTSGEINPDLAALRRGDSVTISGTVRENFDLTTLTNVTTVTRVGTAAVPAPVALSTAVIGQKRDGQTQDAEQWEGMLIRYEDVVVTTASPDGASNFGEYAVADFDLQSTPAAATRVETDNSNAGFTTRTPDPTEVKIVDGMRFDEITGILYYSFSNYKLVPRNRQDYAVPSSVPMESGIAGAIVVPNPSRGSASLLLTLERGSAVSVEIVDAIGSTIATLDAGRISADARVALPVEGLGDGVYFVRVVTGSGVMSLPLVLTR